MTMFKKIWDIISTALVCLVVACAAVLLATRIMGYQTFTVLTGSMAPEYNVGDLVYVKAAPIEEIKVGDDISFVLNKDLVVATHRVVRIDRQNQCFYTKGLANELEDGNPVHYKNVIGTVRFRIPLLGYVSNYMQHPPGLYIAITVFSVLIGFLFVPDLLRARTKSKPV